MLSRLLVNILLHHFFLLSSLDNMKGENNNFLKELAGLYKALAHPIRLEIIKILMNQEFCICNDFVEALPLSQATISEHLRKLKKAGLITLQSKGTASEYRLNHAKFKKFIQMHKEF